MDLKKLIKPIALLVLAAFVNSCATAPGGTGIAPGASPLPSFREGGKNDATGHSTASGKGLRAPIPKNRPGLATGWGDEINDRVSLVGFKRTAKKPAGYGTIYYNDRAGIKAMLDGGHSWKGGGMQEAAGGLIKWGVKSGWATLSSRNQYKKRLIEAKKGKNYSIIVKNVCRSRLEIVLSVDGLDVMDGRTASVKKWGYIIYPGQTLEIKGFRTSDEAVAAFRFSSVGSSYANLKTGNTRNVGVIGVAVFGEKGVDPWQWMPKEVQRRGQARAFAEAP